METTKRLIEAGYDALGLLDRMQELMNPHMHRGHRTIEWPEVAAFREALIAAGNEQREADEKVRAESTIGVTE